MLFVDDDQAELVERREDRRPRADDDVDLAAPDALPLIVPLAVGQAAVLNGHAVAERLAEQRGATRASARSPAPASATRRPAARTAAASRR